MTEQVEDDAWMPVPDAVAIILGRITYYAAWLDDTLGEAVIASSLHFSDSSETTPGWAASGKQLVAALKRIDVGEPKVTEMAHEFADYLDDFNVTRNQLVHGVWLWDQDSVMVLKRSLGPGQRSADYARYSYTELLQLATRYQTIGNLAQRFVHLLRKSNPAHASREASVTPSCLIDGIPLRGAIVGDEIVWRCGICGITQPSIPDKGAGR